MTVVLLPSHSGKNPWILVQLNGLIPTRVACSLHRGSLHLSIRCLTNDTEELYNITTSRSLLPRWLTVRRRIEPTAWLAPVRHGHLLTMKVTCRPVVSVNIVLSVDLKSWHMGVVLNVLEFPLHRVTSWSNDLRPPEVSDLTVEKKTAG